MGESAGELLEEHVIKLINRIKKVDIIVGIPSFNNAGTIFNVIKNFNKGLKKHYPDFKCLIVDSDGGSKDKTVELAEECWTSEGIEKVITRYKGPPGKGSAFRTIFEIARRLNAKVCVVSDADTRSITPQWARALIDPVLYGGYGYVTPYYSRDKHDGTITNALVYPMTRALYGLKIRQPIGGDFAFSNGFLQIVTRKEYWERYPYISKFGVDIWMTTTAINDGFRVCQTVLGTKVHDTKDPAKDLSPMFTQVVSTMFGIMRKYEYKWRSVVRSMQGPTIGDFKFFEVEKISVDFDSLMKKFYDGYEKYKNVWRTMFDRETCLEFDEKVLKSFPEKKLVIPIDLWAKIVYEYACAYNFVREDEVELILDSMFPLYYIRTASFVREAELFSDEIADAVVEGNAGVFERLKGYLIKRWDYYKNREEKISIKNKIL